MMTWPGPGVKPEPYRYYYGTATGVNSKVLL